MSYCHDCVCCYKLVHVTIIELKMLCYILQWATVKLELPHCALKTVSSSLVSELKRTHQHVPGLPIASAMYDRMCFLLPSSNSGNPMDSTFSVGIERTLMYSEAARRETFVKWPHMNYR